MPGPGPRRAVIRLALQATAASPSRPSAAPPRTIPWRRALASSRLTGRRRRRSSPRPCASSSRATPLVPAMPLCPTRARRTTWRSAPRPSAPPPLDLFALRLLRLPLALPFPGRPVPSPPLRGGHASTTRPPALGPPPRWQVTIHVCPLRQPAPPPRLPQPPRPPPPFRPPRRRCRFRRAHPACPPLQVLCSALGWPSLGPLRCLARPAPAGPFCLRRAARGWRRSVVGALRAACGGRRCSLPRACAFCLAVRT